MAFLNFILISGVILFTLLPCEGAAGGDPAPAEIDVVSPPATYPYGFREIKAGNVYGEAWGAIRALDFMGDSLDEAAAPCCNYAGGNYYRSSLLLYDSPNVTKCLWERSQEFSGGMLKGIICSDLAGNGKDDICLLRQLDTAIFLDLFSADDSGRVDYLRIPVAVIPAWARDSGWHSLVIYPLAGVDLNADGNRDLIFSRSSRVNGSYMKDSAFARGMAAWDIHGDSLLWFLPLPDDVGHESFLTLRDSLDEPHFVFLKTSNSNPYEANGMSSNEAYLMGIDKKGREQWRVLVGAGFYSGTPHTFNADSNGLPEIFVVLDGNLPENKGKARLAKYHPFTGEALGPGISLGASRVSSTRAVFDPVRNIDIIVILYPGTNNRQILSLYDKDLNILSSVSGEICGGLISADLTGDSRPELICTTCQSRMLLLDLDLEVLAVSDFPSLPERGGCLLPEGPGLLLENLADNSYYVIRVYERAFWAVFFARYRWWLAVGLALVLFIILYRFIAWISRLYYSAVGLPTLDKINAAVIVLNRKGRILFANKTRLNTAFLGDGKPRGRVFLETPLGRNPAAGEILRKYMADPFVPVQGRHEVDIDNKKRQIEISVFPRTGDNHRNIVGNIIIIEDISERTAWNRKVVMGEAAQKWIHRLKGNMATAKIILENINEDPRLAEFVKNSPVCRNYLDSLKDRIVETSQHSEKILRYVRITDPEPVPTDLNRLVDRVIEIYRETINGKIVVVKEPQQNLPLVIVDPDQMIEVLDNLLSNAISAVRERGRITIKTGMADNLHNKSDRNNVEITVEDNGHGIVPEDMEKIFIPGFTKSGRGTGLGLAIVREIVQNHGGKIEVASEINKGTRFIIKIPARFSE